MRNIFLFLRRFFIFISFVCLQILCFILLSYFSKTHETFFGQEINEWAGEINKGYYSIYQFYNLQYTNKALANENARLHNIINRSGGVPSAPISFVTDSLYKDSLNHYRKFTYIRSTVVSNSVSSQNNYLTLDIGSNQGAAKGMGVVDADGVVGVIVSTSPNFSIVMSLLNHNSKISAILKKGKVFGSLEWDGSDPSHVILMNIPKSTVVSVGDTVLTSSYSSKFPPMLMIGRVLSILSAPTGPTYILKVKTATNFYALQQVYVIKNVLYEEQKQLEGAVFKKDAE